MRRHLNSSSHKRNSSLRVRNRIRRSITQVHPAECSHLVVCRGMYGLYPTAHYPHLRSRLQRRGEFLPAVAGHLHPLVPMALSRIRAQAWRIAQSSSHRADLLPLVLASQRPLLVLREGLPLKVW